MLQSPHRIKYSERFVLFFSQLFNKNCAMIVTRIHNKNDLYKV